MQELLDLLYYYARAVWLKRWYVIAIAWVVCLAGWFLVSKLPDQYEASAQVNIDTESVLRPMLRGLTFTTSPSQQVSLMVSTLLSRPNLEEIARLTDLDITAKTDKEMEELLDKLRAGIKLSKASREQDLYRITYTDSEPAIAKKVVQAVLTVFIENTLGSNREDTVTAKRFLEAEIDEYEQRLKTADNKVVEFKRKNLAYLSSSGADYYQRLKEAMSQSEAAKQQLTEAVRQKEAIEAQIEGEMPTLLGSNNSGVSTVYDQRIAALQSRLDEMSMRYTEKHPDVMNLKTQIEDLEAKREEELQNSGDLVTQMNPIMQSLQLSLNNAETQVAVLQARVNSYQEKVTELQEAVHIIPAIEAEMADLNRDYDVVNSKYQQLLNSREQASLSQSASQATDDIEFEVIDPARVPLEPSGPPRILLMSGVLIIGLGAGLGVAFLLALIRPTFANTKMLALQTGLPVLGVVGMVVHSSATIKSKLHHYGFFFMAFMLLALFSSLLLYQLLLSAQSGSSLIN